MESKLKFTVLAAILTLFIIATSLVSWNDRTLTREPVSVKTFYSGNPETTAKALQDYINNPANSVEQIVSLTSSTAFVPGVGINFSSVLVYRKR